MSKHPNTVQVCGVDLERREPGHNDAYWSGAIGPIRVSVWTRGGQWWAGIYPPASLSMPERMWLADDQAGVVLLAKERAADVLRALRAAETNRVVAEAWLGVRVP